MPLGKWVLKWAADLVDHIGKVRLSGGVVSIHGMVQLNQQWSGQMEVGECKFVPGKIQDSVKGEY